MSWAIDFTTRAKKDLKKLDRQTQALVLEGITLLAETGQGDVVRLKGIKPPQHRLRLGDWRVRLRRHTDGQRLEILHVLPRGKAYDR